MHAAVKGNSNKTAFTERAKMQQEKDTFRKMLTNVDAHK